MRYFAAANTGAAPQEPSISKTQSEVLDAISTADIDGMSPRQAAEFLASMHDRLKEGSDD
jgi:hypothetical protein